MLYLPFSLAVDFVPCWDRTTAPNTALRPHPYVGDRLAIDIATVNGVNGSDNDGGRPPSDAASNESSFFEEEPDELEVDLDKPWEKPSVEHAKKSGKVGVCQACKQVPQLSS